MKTFTRILSLVLICSSFLTIGYTQNSFQFVDDPSGFRPAGSELTSLELESDLLLAKFDASQGQNFKVLEGSIYPIHGSTKNGSDDSWEILLNQAISKSPYFFLLIRDYSKEQLTFRIHLKFPNDGKFSCLNETILENINSTIKGSLINSIGDNFIQREILTIKELATIVEKIMSCDCESLETGTCDPISNFDDLLIGEKFRKREINFIKNYTPLFEDNIIDSSGAVISIDGIETSIPDQIRVSKRFVDPLNQGKVYILDNKSLNDGTWAQVKSEIATGLYDFTEVWFILKNATNSKYFLYSRLYSKLDIVTAKSELETRSTSNRDLILNSYKNGIFDGICKSIIKYRSAYDISIKITNDLSYESSYDEVLQIEDHYNSWEDISCLITWDNVQSTSSMDKLDVYNIEGKNIIKYLLQVDEQMTVDEIFKQIEIQIGFEEYASKYKFICIGAKNSKKYLKGKTFRDPFGKPIVLSDAVLPYAFYTEELDFGELYAIASYQTNNEGIYTARFTKDQKSFLGYFDYNNKKLDISYPGSGPSTLVAADNQCNVNLNFESIFPEPQCTLCPKLEKKKDSKENTSTPLTRNKSLNNYFNSNKESLLDFAKNMNKSVKMYFSDDCSNIKHTVTKIGFNDHSNEAQSNLNNEFENKTFTEDIAIKACLDSEGKWKFDVKTKLVRNSKIDVANETSILNYLKNEANVYNDKTDVPKGQYNFDVGGGKGRFRTAEMSHIKMIAAIYDIGASVIEEAKLPEQIWDGGIRGGSSNTDNVAKDKYDKFYFNMPSPLAGASNQSLDEVTETYQLVVLGVEIFKDPQAAFTGIWNTVKNINGAKVEKMISDASGVSEYLAGGDRALHQGGKHIVKIVMVIFTGVKSLVDSKNIITKGSNDLTDLQDFIPDGDNSIDDIIRNATDNDQIIRNIDGEKFVTTNVEAGQNVSRVCEKNSIEDYSNTVPSGMQTIDDDLIKKGSPDDVIDLTTDPATNQYAKNYPQKFKDGKDFEKRIFEDPETRNNVGTKAGKNLGSYHKLGQIQLRLSNGKYMVADEVYVKANSSGGFDVVINETKLSSLAPLSGNQNQLLLDLQNGVVEFELRNKAKKIGDEIIQQNTKFKIEAMIKTQGNGTVGGPYTCFKFNKVNQLWE